MFQMTVIGIPKQLLDMDLSKKMIDIQEKTQTIEVYPQITSILELTNKDFKITMIPVLKNHREVFKNVYVQSIPPSFLLRNLERVLEISIFKNTQVLRHYSMKTVVHCSYVSASSKMFIKMHIPRLGGGKTPHHE